MVSLRLLSSRWFRRISYELVLRCHQGLAFVMAYALWRYVPLTSKMSRAYLLVAGGTFLSTLVMQCFAGLYRNSNFHRGCPRALIARQNGAVRMTIFPPSSVENQGRTTHQRLDSVNQSVVLPTKSPFHHCILERRRKIRPRFLDRAPGWLHTETI